MAFFSINDDDRKMTLVSQLISREREMHGYEMNISNYETMLASLPQGDWPVLVAGYKGQSIESVPTDLQETVNNYNFRDRIRDVISTEKQELNKSQKIYDAIVAQLQLTNEEIQALVNQVLGR